MFSELCRIFLEMKTPQTAIILLIKVLKVHSSDEELYIALARSSYKSSLFSTLQF
jgi:hypothetical protein